MKLKKFNLNNLTKGLKPWTPIDIATIRDFVIRAAKFDGKYHWHKHDNEDELFIVFKGKIKIQTKNKDIILEEGEGIKISKGIEHCPVSIEPSIVLMFEPLKLKSKGNK
ncbi:cupin domain-containing protein [Candidatus Woesearchaeota archaeon]|nr:cupin domain-containing protein [Candidatus Woesearchaeota archaeon]